MIQVTPADAGKTLAVRAGELIEIALPQASGTGFRWSLAGDSPALDGVSEELLAFSKMPGAELLHRWTFRPATPGILALCFILQRSWERSPAQELHFTFDVS